MQNDIDYIREFTVNANQCKSLALTTKAAVALVGRNGYAGSGYVPSGVYEVIQTARDNHMSIDDVILKENGGWAVIYNDYMDVQGEMMPNGLCDALSYLQDRNQKIYALDWIATDVPISYVSSDIRIEKGMFRNVTGFRGEGAFYVHMEGNDEILISNCDIETNSQQLTRLAKNRDIEKYNCRNGVIEPHMIPEVHFPFYPIANGIVKKPYRIKLFYGGRYLVSNQDGSEFFFYI